MCFTTACADSLVTPRRRATGLSQDCPLIHPIRLDENGVQLLTSNIVSDMSNPYLTRISDMAQFNRH
eukprot:scaffold359869_cov29-Prasinocladus_malaysianus.AAC.1